MTRFAAMMLFQFRTITNGISNKRRVCEERVILFNAISPEDALIMAKDRGSEEEFSYPFNKGEVFFEFVGIKELVSIDALENDEVWYKLVEKVEPMEHKDKIIPNENDLDALRKIVGGKNKVKVPS